MTCDFEFVKLISGKKQSGRALFLHTDSDVSCTIFVSSPSVDTNDMFSINLT